MIQRRRRRGEVPVDDVVRVHAAQTFNPERLDGGFERQRDIPALGDPRLRRKGRARERRSVAARVPERVHQAAQTHAVAELEREVFGSKVVLAHGFLRVVQFVPVVPEPSQDVALAVAARLQRGADHVAAGFQTRASPEQQRRRRARARLRAVQQEHQEQRSLEHRPRQSLGVPLGEGRDAASLAPVRQLDLLVAHERGDQPRALEPLALRVTRDVLPVPGDVLPVPGGDVPGDAHDDVHRRSQPEDAVRPERVPERFAQTRVLHEAASALGVDPGRVDVETVAHAAQTQFPEVDLRLHAQNHVAHLRVRRVQPPQTLASAPLRRAARARASGGSAGRPGRQGTRLEIRIRRRDHRVDPLAHRALARDGQTRARAERREFGSRGKDKKAFRIRLLRWRRRERRARRRIRIRHLHQPERPAHGRDARHR